jgi:predicted transcriptional regulator
MRITITLEDDVAASLKRLAKARRLNFKTLVNLALRQGIKSLMGPMKNRKTFQTRSVDLGPCRIANVDNVAEVLAVAESESFR